jgi:hypothetical protein
LANWKPTKWFDGRQQVDIPAGAFIFSQKTLAKRCRLSRQELRTALMHLESLQCIAVKKRAQKSTTVGAGQYSLLVIENWTTYQSDEIGTDHDSNHGATTVQPQLKKLRREEQNTPLPPKGGEVGISDPDCLPFVTPLDPQPEVLNGSSNHSAAKAETRRAKIPANILETAQRIHARHPGRRQDINVEQVGKKLAAILKHRHIAAHERAEFLARINNNHAGWCACEQWTKAAGEYAKGLEGWLAPTKGRYLVEAPEPKPAQSTSIYTEWDPPGFKSRVM